jgi:hypothetical protein
MRHELKARASSAFGQALAVKIVASLSPTFNDHAKALVSLYDTPVGLLCAAGSGGRGGGDIDQNAVIVRDARDEDRSFVGGTARLIAPRL